MITVNDLIRYDYPCALPEFTPQQTMELMYEYKIAQIPYIVDKEYETLINDVQLDEMDASTLLSKQITSCFFKPFVTDRRHIFETLAIFGKNNISLLPVLNENQQYIGVLLAEDAIKVFDTMRPSMHEGAVIVLETSIYDYSASQIANIIELNDAKILHLFVSESNQKNCLEIILCINQINVNRILQTFNRYHYTVKEVFSSEDANDDLKKHYELLMKYLAI